MKSSSRLLDRFPRRAQILPVFAVVCCIIYGWTTYRFLQKLPSWMLFLNLGEIASNYSYALVVDLCESLLFTGFLIILAFLLPGRFFLGHFTARGTLTALLGLGYLIFLAVVVGQSKASQFPWGIFDWAPILIIVILALSILLPGIPLVRELLVRFADRMIIFLYIIVPLTGLGLAIFVVNNLF